MEENLLSWAIGLYASPFSDEQIAELIQEKTGVVVVDRHTIWTWRNGYGCPKNEKEREALANVLGFKKYSTALVSSMDQVMGVLGSTALKMGVQPSTLLPIKLRKSQKIKLMVQMRMAIDQTGDETAAIGVAIAFWTNYFSKGHPILKLKMKVKIKERRNLLCQKITLTNN